MRPSQNPFGRGKVFGPAACGSETADRSVGDFRSLPVKRAGASLDALERGRSQLLTARTGTPLPKEGAVGDRRGARLFAGPQVFKTAPLDGLAQPFVIGV